MSEKCVIKSSNEKIKANFGVFKDTIFMVLRGPNVIVVRGEGGGGGETVGESAI